MAKFSQLNISKHKGQVLDKIMSWKRQEVARLMDDMPLAQLKALATVAEPPWILPPRSPPKQAPVSSPKSSGPAPPRG